MDTQTHPAILVVEDDPTVGWMLTQTVAQIGPAYPIQYCRNGVEALAYLLRNPAACVSWSHQTSQPGVSVSCRSDGVGKPKQKPDTCKTISLFPIGVQSIS